MADHAPGPSIDTVPSTLDPALTSALRTRIEGEVVLPSDDAYATARHASFHPGSPAVVVRCRSHGDVHQAIAFAVDNDLVLSIRSGGHGGPGFGTNVGGLVLDLSLLDHVELVDDERRLVRIGPGATWAEVAAALAPHGLAVSSGDTGSVGVGGLILGGGMGWLIRQHGLTLDNLVAAEVVVPDGRVLRASADENASLFWALRGGGGNFGVVTEFEVIAHPVRRVLFGTITYAAAEAAAVLKGWRDVMRAAPDDLNSGVMIMPEFPGGPPPFAITVCVPVDDDEDAARALAEPLLHLGEPLAVDVSVKPYAEILEEMEDPPPDFDPVGTNALLPELGDDLIDLVADGVRDLGTMFVVIRSLGGAFARVPTDATAFAQRDSEVVVMTVALDHSPEPFASYSRIRDGLAASATGAYSNFMNIHDDNTAATIYPDATRQRLAAIKAIYDPGNALNQNYNILPAVAGS